MSIRSMRPSRRYVWRSPLLMAGLLVAAAVASLPAWAQAPEAASQAQKDTPPAEAVESGTDATGQDTPQAAAAENEASGRAAEPAVEVPSIVQGSPEPIEPPPTRELHLVLDWYPSPQHAALFVAQAHGELERQGVTLTITTPADPSVPAKLVAADRADLALGREPQLHMLIAQGLPLVRIATLIDTPLSSLIVREDSDITKLTELAGKTVGYAFQDSINPVLATMLNHHGMTLNDVTLEKIDFAMVRALVEKRVDAVIGAPRNVMPALLAQEGITSRHFLAEEHGLPRHDGLVLIANRERLESKRDDIRHLLAALEEATNWMINHPEAAWSLLIEEEPGIDSEANRRAWAATLRRMAPSPGMLNTDRYATFDAFLQERAFIDEDIPVAQLAMNPNST
ncbi:ABC transporter substrate-binding protein [Halomonas sp. YLGW01]|uniref:ABC transporter substrate-binding protein n=1 Tax=Halomonas sp. YLGW01 TaxID=2773308 RepID=UPI001786E759|nr:ABC transporter substrate-binding protein [Halomonas sp. YLGW01]